jgi:hypothetical protein
MKYYAILNDALSEMPDTFTSFHFSKIAVKKGYPKKNTKRGNLAIFLRKHAINKYPKGRTWVKNKALKVVTHKIDLSNNASKSDEKFFAPLYEVGKKTYPEKAAINFSKSNDLFENHNRQLHFAMLMEIFKTKTPIYAKVLQTILQKKHNKLSSNKFLRDDIRQLVAKFVEWGWLTKASERSGYELVPHKYSEICTPEKPTKETYSEQGAIQYLKSKGYKIMKPTTNWEEI